MHEEIRDKFVEKLLSKTKKIVVGDPLDEETRMGPLVSAAQKSGVISRIKQVFE